MPGPMSNPSGVVVKHKLHDADGDPYYRSTDQLDGRERAYLASRGRLTTGKTRKRKERAMRST